MPSDPSETAAGSSPTTESVDDALLDLDTWPAGRVVSTVLAGQKRAADAVAAAKAALTAAVAAATRRLETGEGRLAYAGAGTSGRLAVQDGAELLPTYGWPERRLVTLMAGGDAALTRSVEGAEDDTAAAAAAVADAALGPADVLIAVAASGRTPFACAALEAARDRGALTIGIANSPGTRLLAGADRPILLATGGEVVAGSTRMAAGTAQKIALTTLSTAIMVGLGSTYGPFMVHLAASNVKLDARRIGIVAKVTSVAEARAEAALAEAGGRIPEACLIALGLSPDEARDRVARHSGPFRKLLLKIKAELSERP